MTLTVTQDNFAKGFLQSLSSISENIRIDVYGNVLESLVHTADRTCILSAKCKIESDGEGHFNIPNIKKFVRLISTREGNFNLVVDGNKIKYKGEKISFEYFLLDDSYISKSPLNITQINNLETDVNFAVEGRALQELLKLSAVTSDTEKVYFSTNGNEVVAELNDREKHNVNNVTMTIAEECEGSISTPIPFILDSLRNMSITPVSQLLFKINTERKIAAIQFKPSDGVVLKYVLSGLIR